MEEYPAEDSREPAPAQDDALQYFCQLTFGQFFTLVVLLVMTLCCSFYLGARYGNQYLRLGEAPPPQIATTPALQSAAGPLPESVREDAQLKQLAREALMAQQRGKLEGEVQAMLTAPTPPPPTTTAIAPPAAEEPQPGAVRANTSPPADGLGELTAARGPVESTGPPPQGGPALGGEEGPAGTPVKVKSAGGMPYAVQVGAYRDQKEAAYYVEEWKAKGYAAYLTVADLGTRGYWYRVRLGAFPTKQDAEHYLAEVKLKDAVDAIVVFNEP